MSDLPAQILAGGADFPALSVVLPLVDDRGRAEAGLRSWIAQNLPGETFEIVAVTDDARRSLARRARAVLRSADRLVVASGSDEMGLYQAGAEAARSDLLLFTEAHCVAESGAVQAVVNHFRNSDADAATLAGTAIEENRFARFETRLLEDGLRDRPTDIWRRVALRGFAIRREVWSAAGGFPVECGRLAESILAVRLERSGFRIESWVDARVRHGNCARPRDLLAALRSHGRGQGMWRERCEARLEENFLPPLPDWSERASWERRIARHAARVLLQTEVRRILRGKSREESSHWRRLPGFAAGAVWGAQFPRWRAAARALWNLAAASGPGSEERRYRSYSRASSELLKWGVLDLAASTKLPALANLRVLVPSELPDGVLVGFYASELWITDGAVRGCRWTRPFAMLRLGLAPADYRLTLDAGFPLGSDRQCLRLFFNGRPLSNLSDGSYPVPRSAFVDREQLLTLLCAPFYPARAGLPDSRELGIVLFALRFDATSEN